ncbi:MAG TPA: hypothetical protein VHR72_12910 [Gemmataceae bacterium]|nr:hypothetical protein [Gemmataceae bacterium]
MEVAERGDAVLAGHVDPLRKLVCLDRDSSGRENWGMKTFEEIAPDSEIAAEMEAVIQSLETGKPIDPAIAKRIHERAEKITQRVYREHGLVDIAVPAIRELRGEPPE